MDVVRKRLADDMRDIGGSCFRGWADYAALKRPSANLSSEDTTVLVAKQCLNQHWEHRYGRRDDTTHQRSQLSCIARRWFEKV